MTKRTPLEYEDALPLGGSLPGSSERATTIRPPATTSTESQGEPEPISRRLRRPETLISFGIAIAALLFFLRRLDIHPAEVWQVARHANLWLYGLAFVVWYGSFFIRAARWRRMLARVGIDDRHGYPVPGMLGMVEIFLLSWFANCVVPAKLGDAYRSYLIKQKSGASFSTALGTILAERLTDLTVLFLTMSGVGLIVFRGRVPVEAARTFLLGLALIVVAVLGLSVMWFSRHALQRRLPARIQEQYGRLHDAVFTCLRRPYLFLVLSAIIWLAEGLRFWLVARAVGADLPPWTALFVALMGSLLTTLPITPAGLGVVEIGVGAVLIKLLGMSSAMAGSIILLDRVVAYWSLIFVGVVLYVRRVRQDAVPHQDAVPQDDGRPIAEPRVRQRRGIYRRSR